MEVESSVKFLFSNDFSFFGQIEAGKHIRVSEVNTTKEYNCLIDSNTGSTNVVEIGKIPSSGKNVVAIAGDQGIIRLFDFKSKTQEAELNEHVSRVLALKFQEETGSLFSVSADKKIVRWDLSSLIPVDSFEIDRKGTAGEARCEFIKDDISLLVSLDNKLMLYNTQLKKAEKKFKGHPTSINLLKGMTGSKYFASCSNEDAVYIWSIESETPLLSLPILSQVFFNLDFYKVSAGHFLVLVSSTTCLRLWLVRATKSGMQLKSSVTIPFQDGDLLSARVYKKESIILSVFDEKKPKFHIVSLFANSELTELKEQEVLLQEINSTINQNAAITTEGGQKLNKNKAAINDYHVVGEADENVLNQYRAVKTVDEIKKNAGTSETKGDGVFLMDSLKSYEGGDSMQAESMDSLAVVLVQAIQSNDVQLLDYCFENEDVNLIENTVKKLSDNRVLVLLDRIGERIDSGKKNNYNLFAWLSFVVKHHSSFLIKSPETASKIAPLISLLQKRTLAIDQLYRLKGKIDMVLEVESEVRRQKKGQKKLNVGQRPLVVYEEDEVQMAEKETGNANKQGYTSAMRELEDFEDENNEKEFDDSISEENVDAEFDAYLNAEHDYDQGEDDDQASDESYIGV